MQVLIEDEEFREIKALARQNKVSVAEWVRQALRAARQAQPQIETQRKLEAVRSAICYNFPTADIDQMLGEIESGYGTE